MGGGNWQGVMFNNPLGLMITNVMNAGQWGHLEEGGGRGRAARGGRVPPPRPDAAARSSRGAAAGAETQRRHRSAQHEQGHARRRAVLGRRNTI